MTLDTDISLVLSALQESPGSQASPKVPLDFFAQYFLTTDQADKVYYQSDVSIALSVTNTYDLAGGIVDAFNQSIVLQQVKAMAFTAPASNTTDLRIGGGSFSSWLGDASDFVLLRPGGSLFVVAPETGYTVTAGTGDELKVTNPSLTVAAQYSMVIIGKS